MARRGGGAPRAIPVQQRGKNKRKSIKRIILGKMSTMKKRLGITKTYEGRTYKTQQKGLLVGPAKGEGGQREKKRKQKKTYRREKSVVTQRAKNHGGPNGTRRGRGERTDVTQAKVHDRNQA